MPPEKFNGEHRAIVSEIHKLAVQITEVQTTQNLNHLENKRDIEVLFARTEKLNELPCEAHIEKFTQYDNTRKVLVGTIFGGIILIVTFACAWGSLNNSVEEHHQRAKKVWEKCCVGNY